VDYTPPVSALLTLGRPSLEGEWRNYRNQGIGPEHVADLIRMATDPDLLRSEEEDDFYATVHARRALGQLQAPEAVQPLADLLARAEELDDDWIFEEVPEVLARIGPAALPALESILGNTALGTFVRSAGATGLANLGREHPEVRGECVRALTQQLEPADRNDPEMNAFIIADLIRLQAVESATVIQKAFLEGRVAEHITGTWAHVAYDLKLTDQPPPPLRSDHGLPWIGVPAPPRPEKTAKQKAKARRKIAKKSRQQNRKKKKKK
jgi:hypothetical protein